MLRWFGSFRARRLALLRAELDVIPVAFPLLAPLERQPTARTGFRRVAVFGLSDAGHRVGNQNRVEPVPEATPR